MMLRRRSKQDGIAAIEFALLAPVVIVVLFGMFEFGLALWRKQALTNSVREGARYAIVGTNPRRAWTTGTTPIKTKIETYMNGVGLTDPGRTLTCTGCPCPTSTGSIAQLTISATYPTSFQVLSKMPFGGGMAANKPITSSVTMQCE